MDSIMKVGKKKLLEVETHNGKAIINLDLVDCIIPFKNGELLMVNCRDVSTTVKASEYDKIKTLLDLDMD